MNEVGFRNWMISQGKNPKVISDAVSRLKRLERELNQLDVDEEWKKDQCSQLQSLFENAGRNERMAAYTTTLPIGKYNLSTYKYAVKLYVAYKENTD